MLQTFGKWMIGRAIEREEPLRGWLRRWVDRDDELARFEAASRRLGPLLRRDASAWIESQTQEVRAQRPVRRTRGRAAAAWAVCGLAAATVLVAVAWRTQSGDESAGGPAERSGQVATISPRERQLLIVAWQEGRANLGAWQARVTGASRRIGDLEFRYARFRHTARRFPSGEIAVGATARVLTALDAAAAAQRQDLTAGEKSAYVFFARRLPASVATLVGLQDG